MCEESSGTVLYWAEEKDRYRVVFLGRIHSGRLRSGVQRKGVEIEYLWYIFNP